MVGEPVAYLFSYGTLRHSDVQKAVFGRVLEGRPDALPGFELATVLITDKDVIRTSGSDRHPILRRSLSVAAKVDGMALAITSDDIEAADNYEVSSYTRIVVRLASGECAYVYVDAEE